MTKVIIIRKYSVLVFISMILSVSAFSEGTPSFIRLNNFNAKKSSESGPGPSSTKNFLRYSSSLGALNVKLTPALYWSSLIIEVEYPLTDAFTIGLNILGKLGRTDDGSTAFKIRPEKVQDPAYKLELATKYYFGNTAPIGFYAQFNFSYGNLLFFDGTNRPYTLHSKWKKFEGGVRAPAVIESPKDYSLGIGGGYQLVVIPKKIIANIMVGTQLYLEKDSGIYPAIYVAPSLGYVF